MQEASRVVFVGGLVGPFPLYSYCRQTRTHMRIVAVRGNTPKV